MKEAERDFVQTVLITTELQFITARDELFNHVDDGLEMWEGDGLRWVETHFEFDAPFSHPPLVSVGLTGMDSSQSENQRFHLRAGNITAEGFSAILTTWENTRIARAAIGWTAIGTPRGQLPKP